MDGQDGQIFIAATTEENENSKAEKSTASTDEQNSCQDKFIQMEMEWNSKKPKTATAATTTQL